MKQVIPLKPMDVLILKSVIELTLNPNRASGCVRKADVVQHLKENKLLLKKYYELQQKRTDRNLSITKERITIKNEESFRVRLSQVVNNSIKDASEFVELYGNSILIKYESLIDFNPDRRRTKITSESVQRRILESFQTVLSKQLNNTYLRSKGTQKYFQDIKQPKFLNQKCIRCRERMFLENEKKKLLKVRKEHKDREKKYRTMIRVLQKENSELQQKIDKLSN